MNDLGGFALNRCYDYIIVLYFPLSESHNSESSDPFNQEVYIGREVNHKSPELSAYVSDLYRMEV